MPDRARQLTAAGDALRRQRAARRRLHRRIAAGIVLIGAVLASAALPPRPLLVWNASASAPIGLYGVTAPVDLRGGDMVIARMPAAWRDLAARRRYLPMDVPLVKHVAAEPGDRVCARGRAILVNGIEVATRQPRDPHGRPLPWWSGCVTLRRGSVLLLMPTRADSFDGRYFGPTQASDIVGKAHFLWAG